MPGASACASPEPGCSGGSRELLTPSTPVVPLVPISPEVRSVKLIDATRLNQPGGCGDDWRLHIASDLLAGRLAQVSISDRHGAESFSRFVAARRAMWRWATWATAIASVSPTLSIVRPMPLYASVRARFPCKMSREPALMWWTGSGTRDQEPTHGRSTLSTMGNATRCV